MSMSVVGGLSFLLMGLGAAWIGVYSARLSRSAVYSRDGHLQPRWAPTERRLWLIGWTTMGLGFVCLGVTVLRHSKGQHIVIPASAPLIDRVIWGLFWICLVGGWTMLFVSAIMIQTAEKQRARHEHADEP